jgi:hypothetical protein
VPIAKVFVELKKRGVVVSMLSWLEVSSFVLTGCVSSGMITQRFHQILDLLYNSLIDFSWTNENQMCCEWHQLPSTTISPMFSNLRSFLATQWKLLLSCKPLTMHKVQYSGLHLKFTIFLH